MPSFIFWGERIPLRMQTNMQANTKNDIFICTAITFYYLC